MRKILILGATSAIAQETARLFAARGDRLYLVARDERKLKAVVDDLGVRGGERPGFAAADLNAVQGHEALIREAERCLGGLDIALIAHGTLPDQEACQRSYGSAEKEFQTNFLSAVSLLTILANDLEARKSGCLAVISSVAGDRGRQSNYVYGAAKGGLSIFLQGLRNRLYRSGVAVVTIKPGFVDTPMTAAFKKNPLFVGPDVIARGIVRAIEQRKDIVYLPWFWRPILALIRALPETIFKRLRL